MDKLSSISAFFPAYNDGGTIASMVMSVLSVLRRLTDDYEVIVVNDGSSDYTAEILDELGRIYGPQVRIIHHEKIVVTVAPSEQAFQPLPRIGSFTPMGTPSTIPGNWKPWRRTANGSGGCKRI